MKHLLICREFPPVPYPAGGIGTYARNIARLLAEHGETVHVIGQRWSGAPAAREESCEGRLIVHRVQLEPDARDLHPGDRQARTLFATNFPPQAFGWRASLLAERLVQEEGIDLIEAQEWEAPLYYFQLRRALGQGPARRPPCVIHLHSPTEFIVRHNDWNPDRPDYLTAKRLEDYSISAADGWLCPSRFLARAAESHYGLARDAVEVIPLPLGGSVPLARGPDVWQRGPILYVGRMEPRKGVLEWMAAAVRVARRHPDVRFEFIGADLPYSDRRSVVATAWDLIPAKLRPRFTYYGEKPRSELPHFMAQARIAVVPSRWENFPNTCVEAMGSGLPVVATRQGGMAEMVVDGETGWLADRADPELLSLALERALATPPATLETMGRRAAESIAATCADHRVVERHLDVRRRIAKLPPRRSTSIRGVPRPPDGDRASSHGGMAVILVRSPDGFRGDWRSALKKQSRAPARVILVGLEEMAAESDLGMPVQWTDAAVGDNARSAGIAVARGESPLGYVFLDEAALPAPTMVQTYQETLERCPEVGVVCCWGSTPDPATVGPCPDFPYQLLSNQAGTAIAVRARALDEVGGIDADMPHGYGLWALVNAVIAAGWQAVTFPGQLVEQPRDRSPRTPEHWQGWPRVWHRTPREFAGSASTLLLLLDSERDRLRHRINMVPKEHSGSPSTIFRLPSTQRMAVLREIVRHPARATWKVLWLTKHAIYRQTRRLTGWPRTGATP